jgi:hypothetical protein
VRHNVHRVLANLRATRNSWYGKGKVSDHVYGKTIGPP